MAATMIAAVVGCAEVRVEERTDADSSASGPGSGGLGGVGGAPGGGAGGDGAASTTSSGGAGGAGGDAAPCSAFAWGEPSAHGLVASEAPHVLGDLALAPPRAPGNPAEIAFSHVWQDHGWVLGHVACLLLADQGLVECTRQPVDVQTEVPPPVGFAAEGVPIVVAAEGPNNAQLLAVQPYPDEPLRRTVAADLRGARSVAIGPADTVAVVHGPAIAPELTVIVGTAPVHVGRVACADGAVPVALAAVEPGFLVAHGDVPGACDAADEGGAASTVTISRIGSAGDRTVLHALDLGGPLVEVALVPAGGARAWLAARVDGEDTARLWHVEADGALGASHELPVAAGRGIALAARGEGLAVLDTGPAIHGDGVARVRFLDAALETLATTGAAPLMGRAPGGTPLLHVAADGARIDAIWFATRSDGSAEVVALGARCIAP